MFHRTTCAHNVFVAQRSPITDGAGGCCSRWARGCPQEFACLVLIMLFRPKASQPPRDRWPTQPGICMLDSHRPKGSTKCWRRWALGASEPLGSILGPSVASPPAPPLMWLEALGLNVSISKSCDVKINTLRLVSSYIGASVGILGHIGCIGALPFCAWRPRADEDDAKQACKLLWHLRGYRLHRHPVACGSRPCNYASFWVHPRAHWQHRPPAILWLEALCR